MSREATRVGARTRFGASFNGATQTPNGLMLTGLGLRTKYIVGADGARSSVAKHFQLAKNRRFLVGTEYQLFNIRGHHEDRLHTFLDAKLCPGYLGWLVPNNDFVQIGLARNAPGKVALEAFIQRLAGVFDLSKMVVGEKRAGIIPSGGPVWPFFTPQALLIGDAAGWVSPLTGGGIHTAFALGRLSGRLIAEHLLDGGENPGRALTRQVPRYLFKRGLRGVMNHLESNTAIELAFATPGFRRAAELVYFHHRGLFQTSGWRALLAGQEEVKKVPPPV